MFLDRLLAPKRPQLTLESLDARLRHVEAQLEHQRGSAVETMRADLRHRPHTSLDAALASYTEARQADRAKRGVTD